MKKVFKLLATHGGKIVSTNDLTEMEITQSRASNRIYVDEDSLGYVWLPPFHGRFPVTASEVEMFEWCYPLEVELPEELSVINYSFFDVDDISFHIKRIKKIQINLKKKEGNLTCRVLLRALNCEYEKNKVSMSVKELFHWFETGQHMKQWKEVDTI
jgi:hypothetical protein